MMKSIHKIGLGTVQFGMPYGISNSGGQTSKKEVSLILNRAREQGIYRMDTASAYGNSEEVLGDCGVSSFHIVSKFMPPVKGESIGDQLRKSLARLKVDTLYGYLAHRPEEVFSDPDQWRELLILQEEGKVRRIGFSLTSGEQVRRAIQADMVPDIVQVPFNYFDQRFAPYLEELKEYGCEVHTRSAFLQGLFFCNTSQLAPYFNPVKEHIVQLQQSYGRALPAALLNYCLNKSFIDCVMVGVNKSDQLTETLVHLDKAGEPELSADFDIPEQILNPSNWPSN